MSSGDPQTRVRILEATWKLLTEGRGQGVRIKDIAAAAGVSRQAVYLHFGSRAELLVATTHYVDEAQGVDERVRRFAAATGGVEVLEEWVEFWGNYIPAVYGIAKALLALRETDEAAAAAWEDRMAAVRGGCRRVIKRLSQEGLLAREWEVDEAVDMLWSLLHVHTWANLTLECGWTTAQYVEHMKTVLKRSLVES